MAWRYAVVFFLVVLLLGILGLIFGYLTLDTTAPLERQLTASGALAYCDDDECYDQELRVIDAIDAMYDRELETIDRADASYDRRFIHEEEEWRIERPSRYSSEDSEEIIVEEWDEWRAPRTNGRGWDEVWYVEGEYWIDSETRRVQNPWYVSAFPGIGRVVQQIIPGQIASPLHPSTPPRPAYPQPSCWITAQPLQVELGGASALSWSAFNATHASLTDFGGVPLSGSRLVQNVRTDRTYQLSVTGAGGSSSCYTRITIHPAKGAASCIISAYPSTIHVGDGSNLAWGSANAASAYLSGVGAVSPQGGTYVEPQASTTYTLTVFGLDGGSSACMTEIGVLP